MEMLGLFILAAAAVLGLIGFVWLVIVAFRTRTAWGLGVLFFPPSGLIFIPTYLKRTLLPALLLAIAALGAATPFVLNHLYGRIDLGPHEHMVKGEMHLTLTGWDRTDYSVLKDRPQVVVLQMANADVNDQTLEYLRGMDQLRELDLNDTQVTDEGLKVLRELPRLETLWLRKTPITDEGFREALFDKESLRELDLTGTKVASKTVREWRKAKPDRRALH